MTTIEVREEVELLPCPFCGWDEPSIRYDDEAEGAARKEPRVRIECGRPFLNEERCTAEVRGVASDAARQWNRRYVTAPRGGL